MPSIGNVLLFSKLATEETEGMDSISSPSRTAGLISSGSVDISPSTRTECASLEHVAGWRSLLENNAGGGFGFVANISSNSVDDVYDTESVMLDADSCSTALDTAAVTAAPRSCVVEQPTVLLFTGEVFNCTASDF